jgi:hypothetical protein
VTEVRFWLVEWEHQCWGDHRKVGDTITVNLSYEGSAHPSDGPLSVATHRDGTMTIVGDVSGLGRSQPAWLVNAGEVSVAWAGKYPGPRVRLHGRLYEERHSDISAEVTGRITGMRWHEAISHKDAEGHRRISYENPTLIYNTNKYPGFPQPVPPGILRMRELVKKGQLKGPFTFKPSKTDRKRTAWAFEFILEV